MATHPDLSTALAAAIAAARGAAKDARHQQGYQYASAESVLSEAREALAAHGLSIVPASATVDWTGQIETRAKDGTVHVHDVGVLSRRCSLLGPGGAIDLLSTWPVVCGPGRPRDKAIAGALTSSLAYLVRDLLLLPRLTEDQLDARSSEHDAVVSAPVAAAPPPLPPHIAAATDILRELPRDHGRQVVAMACELLGIPVQRSAEILASEHGPAFAEVLSTALAAVEGDATRIHTYISDRLESR